MSRAPITIIIRDGLELEAGDPIERLAAGGPERALTGTGPRGPRVTKASPVILLESVTVLFRRTSLQQFEVAIASHRYYLVKQDGAIQKNVARAVRLLFRSVRFVSTPPTTHPVLERPCLFSPFIRGYTDHRCKLDQSFILTSCVGRAPDSVSEVKAIVT